MCVCVIMGCLHKHLDQRKKTLPVPKLAVKLASKLQAASKRSRRPVGSRAEPEPAGSHIQPQLVSVRLAASEETHGKHTCVYWLFTPVCNGWTGSESGPRPVQGDPRTLGDQTWTPQQADHSRLNSLATIREAVHHKDAAESESCCLRGRRSAPHGPRSAHGSRRRSP